MSVDACAFARDVQRIGAIAGRESRGRYTGEQTARFVEETIQLAMALSAAARMHGIRHDRCSSGRVSWSSAEKWRCKPTRRSSPPP